MIAARGTGHAFAPDGHLLRIDVMAGRWVATRFTPNLVIRQQVFSTNESVHQQISHWLSPNRQR
jgi:hypothetical protein